MADFILEGQADLERKLKEIGAEVEKVLGAAVAAGATLSTQLVSAGFNSDGIAWDMIEAKKERATAHVGPDKDHWYLKFLETGVQPHLVRAVGAKALKLADGTYRASAVPGGFPARPVLRTLYETNQAKVQNAVGSKFKQAVG